MKRLHPGTHVFITYQCVRFGVRRVQVLNDRRPAGKVIVSMGGRPVAMGNRDWWLSEAAASVEAEARIRERIAELREQADQLEQRLAIAGVQRPR